MKRKLFKVLTFCIVLIYLVPLGVSAQTENDLMIEICGEVIDIQKLAVDNGVDPYALKAAIEEGLISGKCSPFANLPSTLPNTPSESISVSNLRTAAKTAYKTNQNSTAYTSDPDAKTASGKTPAVGMCAMKVDFTSKTEATTSTKVKLGTTIYMDTTVVVNGTTYSSFVVEDRGKGTGRTDFWIDIYFGLYANYQSAALTYGVKNVSYHYLYWD